METVNLIMNCHLGPHCVKLPRENFRSILFPEKQGHETFFLLLMKKLVDELGFLEIYSSQNPSIYKLNLQLQIVISCVLY